MPSTPQGPKSSLSSLEQLWIETWFDHCPPRGIVLRHNFKFHPQRRWRLDWVHLPSLVAIELDGVGAYYGNRKVSRWGGHQTPKGIALDNEKRNAALDLGWIVYRFTRANLSSKAKRKAAIRQVTAAILKRQQQLKQLGATYESILDAAFPQCRSTTRNEMAQLRKVRPPQ